MSEQGRLTVLIAALTNLYVWREQVLVKNKYKFLFLVVCFLTCVSCAQKVNIGFTFQVDQVEKIELYRIDNSEKSDSRIISEESVLRECVTDFSNYAVESTDFIETTDSAVYFRFHLTDGDIFTISYIGKGVKNGIIQTSNGDAFQSSADIGGVWSSLYDMANIK